MKLLITSSELKLLKPGWLTVILLIEGRLLEEYIYKSDSICCFFYLSQVHSK